MVVAACMGECMEVECISVAWAAACVSAAWVSQAAASVSQVGASEVRLLRMQGLPSTADSSITATIALRSLVYPTPTPPTTAAGAGRGRHTDCDGSTSVAITATTEAYRD